MRLAITAAVRASYKVLTRRDRKVDDNLPSPPLVVLTRRTHDLDFKQEL
jgi:hypothetical protein